MGANAQTSVPDFTAGQVLTAAQMTEVNTGIPVFADSSARDAAFGGTGEKVLAEGQYAYLESTNATQFYDGSSWKALGGLTLIESNTFSAVASVSATANVFSSSFAYYRILFHLTAASTNLEVYLRMRESGTDYSGAGYTFSGSGYTSAGSGFQVTGQTFAFVGYIKSATTPQFAFTGDFFNPNAATYTNIIGSSFTSNSSYTATSGIVNSGSVVATATQYDAFSFIASTGNFTGRYSVYGYNQ